MMTCCFKLLTMKLNLGKKERKIKAKRRINRKKNTIQ